MTINEAQDRIIADFSHLSEWIDKCEHLIELGKKSLVINCAQIKSEENALKGCQSQVWIYAQVKDGLIEFFADSDSVIIKGVLTMLLKILNGQSPVEVVCADLYFLKEIGLSTNLSPTRANGVASIVSRMKQLAKTMDC